MIALLKKAPSAQPPHGDRSLGLDSSTSIVVFQKAERHRMENLIHLPASERERERELT